MLPDFSLEELVIDQHPHLNWPLRSRFLLLLAASVVTGCSHESTGQVTVKPPVVTVSRPLSREVTEYAEFTGRTEAVEVVEIQARVNGYLDSINFEAGDEVKKGD